MDVFDYTYEPIILEKVPNLEDGDAQVSPVTANAGTKVVDSSGNVVTLATGTKVRPSGCRADDCAITYDGSSSRPDGSDGGDLYPARRPDVVGW